MNRTSTGRKVDAGNANRRIPRNPKLKLKSKPKAESFASAQESLRETPSHFIPNQNSQETGDKQVAWSELEIELERRPNTASNELDAELPRRPNTASNELDAELPRRTNASLNDSTAPTSTSELNAEPDRCSNGSLKELHAPRSTASGELDAELGRRMKRPPHHERAGVKIYQNTDPNSANIQVSSSQVSSLPSTASKSSGSSFLLEKGVAWAWSELEFELERRTNASLKLNAELGRRMNASLNPVSTSELDAELDRVMDGSLKELNASRSTALGELGAELDRCMKRPPRGRAGVKIYHNTDSNLANSQVCRVPSTGSKSGGSSGLEKGVKMDTEKDSMSTIASQASTKITDVESEAETPISEKRPQLQKKRKTQPNGGSQSEKNWTEKLKNKDSRSPMSTSSSSEITTNTSFGPKVCKKRFWLLRNLNFKKSVNNLQKDVTSLQQQIGATTGEMQNSGRKEKRRRPDHSKEESWLQRVVKDRNQVWLEQAQIAMKEAKANQKSSEMRDVCDESSETESDRSGENSYPMTGKTWINAMKEAKAKAGNFETESDQSGHEYSCSGTDTRLSHYGASVVVDADDMSVFNLQKMFSWLTCSPTEPDMRRFDPSGMVIGGKCGRW